MIKFICLDPVVEFVSLLTPITKYDLFEFSHAALFLRKSSLFFFFCPVVPFWKDRRDLSLEPFALPEHYL